MAMTLNVVCRGRTHDIYPINVIDCLEIKPSQIPVACWYCKGNLILSWFFSYGVFELGKELCEIDSVIWVSAAVRRARIFLKHVSETLGLYMHAMVNHPVKIHAVKSILAKEAEQIGDKLGPVARAANHGTKNRLRSGPVVVKSPAAESHNSFQPSVSLLHICEVRKERRRSVVHRRNVEIAWCDISECEVQMRQTSDRYILEVLN